MKMTYRAHVYRTWIAVLVALIAAGIWCYVRQLELGLGLTGMSRDVTWGLYIGQFIFAEGIAASVVVLLHKAFGKVVLFGQLIAIAGVIASMLFIVADMGRPSLVLNVLWHASPGSVMFWDMLSLGGFLALNIVIAAVTLDCERKEIPPPGWLRPVILLSIPWAIGMQTVAAFLYCGLPGRSFWLTAILAPRFLVSAFAAGPALLILIMLVLRRIAGVPVQDEALRGLGTIVSYAMALNLFFILLEVFTAFYAQIPEPMEHFRYLFLAPWMWTSAILAIASLVLLGFQRNLALASVAAFASLWIDKGFGMVIGGFVPSPNGSITEYLPTAPEIAIAAGIWAAGALIATLLFRTAIGVRADAQENSELLLIKQEVSY